MGSKFIVGAAACLSLAACGDWKSGQANSAQGNISTDSRTAMAAVATTEAAPTGTARTKDEALRIMHERHEGMENIGKATKAAGHTIRSDSPDLNTIRTSAATLSKLSQQAPSWFAAGTGPDVGKTGAKPNIWTDPQGFKQKLQNFQSGVQAFNVAANSGDMNQIKQSFATMGKACESCHDNYRVEMKH